MITTLKELKAKYPGLVTTSGRIYNIDGLGWFYQKTRFGAIETFTKDFDDTWIRTDFSEIVGFMEKMYK